MKKTKWTTVLLIISLAFNIFFPVQMVRLLWSYERHPVGTYTFPMETGGEYREYYLLIYPESVGEYELRMYTGSDSDDADPGSACKTVEKGEWRLEKDRNIVHTTSEEGVSRYYFLTTDDMYFVSDGRLITCVKKADYVYKF